MASKSQFQAFERYGAGVDPQSLQLVERVPTQETMMKTTFRAVAAATGFSALALQYWLEVHLPRAPNLFVSTINFLSYFTILANAASALATCRTKQPLGALSLKALSPDGDCRLPDCCGDYLLRVLAVYRR